MPLFSLQIIFASDGKTVAFYHKQQILTTRNLYNYDCEEIFGVGCIEGFLHYFQQVAAHIPAGNNTIALRLF
jgi:hypothetical protein